MSDARRKKRHPAPPESVGRRIAEAQETAVKDMQAIMLTVLCDKYGADADIIIQILTDFEKLADEITEGRVTTKDLCKTLKSEYGIDLD